MQCPKCSIEAQGNFCTKCGFDFRQLVPPNNTPYPTNQYSPNYPQTQMPPNSGMQYYPPQNNLYYNPYTGYSAQPYPQPEWYLDGSIYGLILAIASFFVVWDVWILLGLGMCLVALILGISSKKKNGRIATLTIILSSIIFAVELLLSAVTYLLI